MAPATVSYELDGFPLLLPSTTQLPGIRQYFPNYGTNVGRLARTLLTARADLRILDIGANVGDTVATLRHYVASPILCVEGCGDYLPLLNENLRQFADVEVEPCFIGGQESQLSARLVVEKGTAYLEPNRDQPVVPTRGIEEILKAHPKFTDAKFWKIDTDGWDAFIIQQSITTIRRIRPVLFFEYDPHFFVGELRNCSRVFETLEREGYHDLLFWENTGDFHVRANLGQRELIQDLHESVVGREKARYWDIAAFPKEDSAWAAKQREEELALFRQARSAP